LGLGVAGDELKCPGDFWGDRRRSREVGALGLEAVLVGDVLHRDGGAVVGGVAEAALVGDGGS